MGRKTQTLQISGPIDWTAVQAERLVFESGCTVFSQGDAASTVMYIDRGGVRLSVLSYSGKEAVIAVLESADFFGESCLAGQPKRMATATTMVPTAVRVITRKEVLNQLHSSSAFADCFLAHMLKRNLRIERDLTDQLFNNSEKRLARALLLLSQYGQDARPRTIQKVSQEILAEMIGTTRTRVNFFMNRFRNLGYIEYKSGGDLTVHQALLNVSLHAETG
jgi:CRP/FNR family cyclic AMP-dependent transcriptional regulator